MRGAIGPIGDDIPSIFPIVAGVLLFMSTAIYASDQLSQKNAYLEISKAGAGLSYVVLSSPYLDDELFEAECQLTYREYAARRRVDFLITVKKFCHYTELGSDIFSIKNPYEAQSQPNAYPAQPHSAIDKLPLVGEYHHKGLSCASDSVKCIGGQCGIGTPPKPPKNFQSFNYPVAVDCGENQPFVGLGALNVIVWRGS